MHSWRHHRPRHWNRLAKARRPKAKAKAKSKAKATSGGKGKGKGQAKGAAKGAEGKGNIKGKSKGNNTCEEGATASAAVKLLADAPDSQQGHP